MSSSSTTKLKTEEVVNIDDPRYRITPLQQAAASCTGAVLTSFFVTPLDVVKIRLQAQQKTPTSRCFLYCNGLMDHICGCCDNFPSHKEWYQRPGHFTGTVDAFVKISRAEGLSSLWSGLSPTLVLAIPSTIIYFVSYEQLRLRLMDWQRRRGASLSEMWWTPLMAGASSRIISVGVVSPLELIRTKMQSQRMSYLEVGRALRSLIRQDGISGLWKGVLSTLLRDVPFSAVYWYSYESIKTRFAGRSQAPPFALSFVAGAVSGGLAATLTVPFDVVKTHKQIEFGDSLYSNTSVPQKSNVEMFKQIYRQNGFRGLYAGLVPRLIKVAPACAIMISTFEYSKVFFYRLAAEKDNYSMSVETTHKNVL